MKLVVLFVQYDKEKYANAYNSLRSYLDKLTCNVEVVILDNKLDAGHPTVYNNTRVINGDNSAWEFSAWDKGLKYLKENYIDYDAVLFVNDSFMVEGLTGTPDEVINLNKIVECVSNKSFVTLRPTTGKLYFELEVVDVSTWYRTHCFILSKEVLREINNITTYTTNFIDTCINGEVDYPYFKETAPLNKTLQDNLVDRLTRRWHSAFKLEEDWNLFRMKTLAYLNELMLTYRLNKTK